jgi:hypothetical protein
MLRTSEIFTICIICLALLGCGGSKSDTVDTLKSDDSKIASKVTKAVIDDMEREHEDHSIIFNASSTRIDRIEKGNPSKEIIDKYDPKAVYCVKCKYDWEYTLGDYKYATYNYYIAIERQTGEITLISLYKLRKPSMTLAQAGNNAYKKSQDEKRRMTDAIDIMIDLWDSTCPFPGQYARHIK